MTERRVHMQRVATSDPSQQLWLSPGAIAVPPWYPAGVVPIDGLETMLSQRYLVLAGDPLPLFVDHDGVPLEGGKLGLVEQTRHPRRSPWATLLHMPSTDSPDVDDLRALQALLALNHTDGVVLIAGFGDTLIIRRQRYALRATPAGSPVLEQLPLLEATLHNHL